MSPHTPSLGPSYHVIVLLTRPPPKLKSVPPPQLLRTGTVTYGIVYVHKCAHVPQFLLEVGTGAYEGVYTIYS